MDIEEHIKHWLNGAEHDIKVATNLFQAGNYDWCLFIGHIVLEKTLKAIYVQNNNNKIPPKTHKLVKLAKLSFLNLTEDQNILLDEVTEFNIEVRYPQYKKEFHKLCTKEYTTKYLISAWPNSNLSLRN